MLAKLQGQKTYSRNGHKTDKMQLQLRAHVQWREYMLWQREAAERRDTMTIDGSSAMCTVVWGTYKKKGGISFRWKSKYAAI